MYPIQLALADGETLRFEAQPNTTLLEAAAHAGWQLPALCKEGGCGSCRAQWQTGNYRLDSHSEGALSTAEAQRGGVLLCRTYPLGEMVLKAPFKKEAVLTNDLPIVEATLTQLTDLGGQVVQVDLQTDAELSGSFEPGQFIQIQVPDQGGWRAYSLANQPNWAGQLQLLVRLHPNGVFSSWLKNEAIIGDTLKIQGAQGHFTLQENGLAPRWFVGGGTGLAPLLSMLGRMAEWQALQPARLYFGVNTEEDLFDLTCLNALKDHIQQLDIRLFVWHPSEGWTGETGTPIEALQRDLAATAILPDLYFCGPPGLVEAGTAVALATGVPEDHIFSERFTR